MDNEKKKNDRLAMTERAFEVMQMLQECRDGAYTFGVKDTAIYNVKPDSFKFVCNAAIDLIIKLCGGVGV